MSCPQNHEHNTHKQQLIYASWFCFYNNAFLFYSAKKYCGDICFTCSAVRLCHMRHQATFQDAFSLVILLLLLAHYLKSYDDDC